MRRRRFLAPWRREDFRFGEIADGEELSAEALAALKGKPAIYHCLSRVVDRRQILGPEEKEHFVWLMRLYERFCGLRVLTFAVMSNHFHLLLEVPARPAEPLGDEELLERLGLLYGKREVAEIREELESHRRQRRTKAAEALRQRYLARMYDLSAYMKIVKQRFTQWYNARHGREGTLWEGRFKSVLVEDGHAARVVAAYIDLNPLRAGLVEDPKDYRWCGYAEAVAGRKAAREGLLRVMFEMHGAWSGEEVAKRRTGSWREVGRQYREILYLDGGPGRPEKEGGTRRKGVKTFSVAGVKEVLESGGRLSEAEMLRCRVRYFSDGLVLGAKGFLDAVFVLGRERFPAGRRSGPRRLRGVETGLCSLRDLQRQPLG